MDNWATKLVSLLGLLVLVSAFLVVSVNAAPFNYNWQKNAQQFSINKIAESQLVKNAFQINNLNLVKTENKNYQKNNALNKAFEQKSGVITKNTGDKLVNIEKIPLGGKKGKEEQKKTNAGEICKDPRFACGHRGYAEPSYQYGTGTSVNYHPTVTSEFKQTNAHWFNDYNDYNELGRDEFVWPGGFEYPQEIDHSICITADDLEYDMESVDEDPPGWKRDLIIRTVRALANSCHDVGAVPVRSPCAEGTRPEWDWTDGGRDNWQVLNPADSWDARLLRTTIAQFGEVAWCDWKLELREPLLIEVQPSLSSATFTAQWTTSLFASNDLLSFYKILENGSIEPPVNFTGRQGWQEVGKNHEVTGQLELGMYMVRGVSCTVRTARELSWEENPFEGVYLGQCTDFELQDEAGSEVFLVVPALSPEPVSVSFVEPTPVNGAALTSDSATITISASEPLENATVVLTTPQGTVQRTAMSISGPTSFSASLTQLRAGVNAYYVEAHAVSGAYGVSENRTFATPSPFAYYTAPTPTNGAVQTATYATISITANELLSQATLVLASVEQEFQMTELTNNHFTFTINDLQPGRYEYYVRIVDESGDFYQIEPRILIVVPLEESAPILQFTPPTPDDNTILPGDFAGFSIHSNEPLTSAVLYLTYPNGTSAVVPMVSIDSSSADYTIVIFNLRAGTINYRAEGIDEGGVRGITETRSIIAPLPILSFVSPTPQNRAIQAETSATITISANEPLQNATLVWTTNSITNRYNMTPLSLTDFTYTLTNLPLETHSYYVEGLDDEGDATTTSTRTLTVSIRTPTEPQITFIEPTPVNEATLTSDSATVAISSNEMLTSATLVITTANGEVGYAMIQDPENPTEYRIFVPGLRAGINRYYVEAFDEEGDMGQSETHTFNVPLPIVSFDFPTPSDNSAIILGSEITISISSDEPLANVNLVWTTPTATIQYAMVGSGTSFSYSITPTELGSYSYRIDVMDDEGDETTTITRSLDIIDSGYPQWQYRREVVLNSGVASTLTDFPTRITLNTAQLIADGKLQTDCDDLRVVNTDNTIQLAFEIEKTTCNTANTIVWTKIPSLASGNYNIYTYYGNPTATNTQNAKSVWSNGYAGVWHFAGDLTDSLEITNASGTTSYVSTFLGQAVDFSVGDDLPFTTPPTSFPYGNAARTVTAWAQGASTDMDLIFGYGRSGGTPPACYTIGFGTPGTGNNAVTLDAWGDRVEALYTIPTTPAYYAWTYTRTETTARINNTQITTGTLPNGMATSTDAPLGGFGRRHCGPANFPSDRQILELRIHNETKTTDWLNAEWGQTSTVSSEEPNN